MLVQRLQRRRIDEAEEPTLLVHASLGRRPLDLPLVLGVAATRDQPDAQVVLAAQQADRLDQGQMILVRPGLRRVEDEPLGQVVLARRLGKRRIIAETGAGQHGVATATACARFGLECVVYMGSEDMRRQAPNVERMELLGATVAGSEIHALWEDTYQIYDARTGRWRSGPPPTVARHALQLFRVGGGLYAVGGCTTALRDSPVVEFRRVA